MSEALEPIAPREAFEMFLDHQAPRATEETVRSYRYRLKLFVEWCEDETEGDVQNLNTLTGRSLQRYEAYRRGQDVAVTTLKNELSTLRKFLEYAASIEGVTTDLQEKILIPSVSSEDGSDDVLLRRDRAEAILEYFRRYEYASRRHALLEVTWHTGIRMGALRGLDLEDFNPTERYLELRHTPETDTPLKNKSEGERVVALSDAVAGVLEDYVDVQREAVVDDHGRAPLFATTNGRPDRTTLRREFYEATRPCLYTTCPHNRDPEDCRAMEHGGASRCPSSRSPHQVRTGSITHQLNEGVPVDTVSERVNASRRVLEEHYDIRSPVERMENRRDHLEVLE